ncbi:MAG: hypothetical protein JNN03_05695 [Rubrivivax sp.]|nr:hypothetical protein [Rubrivivax sp.]
MSSVVDLPSPYIATRTAAQAAPSRVATTRSVRELNLENAWSALAKALQDDLPVTPTVAAIDEAFEILEMLPSGIQPPEPVIEDSGTIAWVWDSEVGKFLALAVNGTGTIQRSAIIAGKRSWDTTPLLDRLSGADVEVLARFRSLHA